MEAVYTLMNIDHGVPEVWGSEFDVRDMLKAVYHLRDEKKITEMKMNPIEKLALKIVLKMIRGTDAELMLKKYKLI